MAHGCARHAVFRTTSLTYLPKTRRRYSSSFHTKLILFWLYCPFISLPEVLTDMSTTKQSWLGCNTLAFPLLIMFFPLSRTFYLGKQTRRLRLPYLPIFRGFEDCQKNERTESLFSGSSPLNWFKYPRALPSDMNSAPPLSIIRGCSLPSASLTTVATITDNQHSIYLDKSAVYLRLASQWLPMQAR